MKKESFVLGLCGLACFSSFAQEQKDSLQSVKLQEVQVISVRATYKTPLAYSDMSKKEIEQVNFGQDIPFLLTLTPSVVATSDAGAGVGYTGFRIRGTDANRINVTTNGIPMNEAESQGVFWVNIPDFVSSVEDIQVQRGVGTSTNGAGAFGASINLKTENIPNRSYGELNGSYGSFNTSKATVKLGTGLLGKHWAFDGRLSGIHSDGYIDRASSDLKSYFLQGGYYAQNTMLKLVTFSGSEKTYHAWDGVPKDNLETDRTYNPSGYMGKDSIGNPMYYDNQTDNYNQTHYQLIFLHIFNDVLKLNAALHYTKGQGFYEEYKDKRSLQEYGLTPFLYLGDTIGESDLVRQKWLDNDFGGTVFSLDYNKDKLDFHFGGGANRYVGNHFGKLLWAKNYVGEWTPGQEYYRGLGKKNDINVFAKANYMLTKKWNLYLDLQYRFVDYKISGLNDTWDDSRESLQLLDIHHTFNFFNPKAGLFFSLNKNNSLYASFATAHREPNRNNYTDSGLDSNPTYETLYDYEAGYTFKDKSYSAGVNLYYMKYNDQLILTGKVNEIGEMLTSNVPDSYRMGVELMAGWQPVSWLKWNFNLTLSRNEIKDYTEYLKDWNEEKPEIANYLGTTPISFSPEVIAGNLFSFSLKKWSAGLQSSYVGKQYIDNTGNEDRKLDPYFVNNLRLGYTFHLKGLKSISLNLLVNNIFNEQYESNAWVESGYYTADNGEIVRDDYFGYFPQAGINALVNLSLKF